MEITTKEKKCAITTANHRLLIYISGKNTRYLSNLEINNINNKADFNGPAIMSLLSRERNSLCRMRET